MPAVAGAPQMLSSYFDIRTRREDAERHYRAEREESERRHWYEERRRQEAERRHRDEECRHWYEECRRQDQERWRQDEERRHREMMLMLAVVIGERRRQERAYLLRTMQGVIDDLRAENARLRGERSDVADRDR